MIGARGRGAGWLARAQRHVEDVGDDCVECGYLLLPTIFKHLDDDDNESAATLASDAAGIGERCADADLVAIARNLQGRALLRQGLVEQGLAHIDEAMLAASSGELSAMAIGLVYCNALATCQQAYLLDRAREWTAALAAWCEEQPQLVTFTGNCRVHRAEILQLSGDWPAALEEVRRICERDGRAEDPEVYADAYYQQGELFRLRGELTDAETAYQRANRNGRDPQPGLALLRLAQGRQDEAVSAIRRVLSTTTPIWQRARVLPAFVDIMLAVDELELARAAADELAAIAQKFSTPVLGAVVAHARGAIRLADGEPRRAVEPLRRAFGVWHRIGAPYIAARIRVRLARAYFALDDRDGAELELRAARRVFERLGAAADLAELASTGVATASSTNGLSRREVEVLRLVADGRTNKAIAAELRLSERTVERHVSNIFAKIDVSSRAAATAYAYQRRLV